MSVATALSIQTPEDELFALADEFEAAPPQKLLQWAIDEFGKCPINVLAERDVKGLYKKALAGEIKEFTGVSDPYEEPLDPEIVVETDRESIQQSAAKIIDVLERRVIVGDRLPQGSNSIAVGLAALTHGY